MEGASLCREDTRPAGTCGVNYVRMNLIGCTANTTHNASQEEVVFDMISIAVVRSPAIVLYSVMFVHERSDVSIALPRRLKQLQQPEDFSGL